MVRFTVFGTLVGICREGSRWQAFHLGNEGKRRRADIVVPDDVAEDELCEYLADLFHENATPRNHETRRLD